MEKTISLTNEEAEFLRKPVNCKRAGGFQLLLRSLQERMYQNGHKRWFVRVDRGIAERLVRYSAAKATHGGYQTRLRGLANKAAPILRDLKYSQLALPFGASVKPGVLHIVDEISSK